MITEDGSEEGSFADNETGSSAPPRREPEIIEGGLYSALRQFKKLRNLDLSWNRFDDFTEETIIGFFSGLKATKEEQEAEPAAQEYGKATVATEPLKVLYFQRNPGLRRIVHSRRKLICAMAPFLWNTAGYLFGTIVQNVILRRRFFMTKRTGQKVKQIARGGTGRPNHFSCFPAISTNNSHKAENDSTSLA